MSASESTDCYLCGARNDADADSCVRCDGQLLRLPSDALDLETTDHTDDLIVDEVPDVVEDVVQRRPARRARSGSVEDQRLSDALGLTTYDHDDDDVDPDFMETVVTSIPRAKQSASIPLIGTRTGMVPQAAMHAKEFGRRTYVLLAVLLGVTAWLGWNTLSNSDDPLPDSVAFTDTTLPPTTTTTTEAPSREWSEAEVTGRYGAAFTRVQLYACPSETPEGATINVVPLDDMWTAGIAIDEHNVLINTTDLPSANAAIIRARNGAQRLAVVQTGPARTRLATTTSTISRNLDLGDTSDGSPTFFVSYDHESNRVNSADAPSPSAVELTVTNTGDVDEVRLGANRLDAETLRSINQQVETVEDEDAPDPQTICDRANRLASSTSDPSTEDQEAN